MIVDLYYLFFSFLLRAEDGRRACRGVWKLVIISSGIRGTKILKD